MAFSSAQVTIMDSTVTAIFVRCQRDPSEMSLPMLFWASTTLSICVLNLGMNRRVILSTKDIAGMMRPKR